MNALTAATDPDPYPYYARLLAGAPLSYDGSLQVWVAASADAVRAILTSERCSVRPPAEPVPRGLLDTEAGSLFAQLARMSDGPAHASRKAAVTGRLAALETAIASTARTWAQTLDARRLEAYAFDLPAYAVGGTLGLDVGDLAATSAWVGALARAFAPGAGSLEIARGSTAAENLRGLFASYGNRELGVDNAIGIVLQAREATAGLILNTLLALAAHPHTREALAAGRVQLGEVVAEVARCDPPVQNTRRFVTRASNIMGCELREGDGILLLLAAANRDPSLHRDPDRFDPARTGRRSFTFGAGVHACPGEGVAVAIASAGVRALLERGIDAARLSRSYTYHPSLNARIPVFLDEQETPSPCTP